MTLYLGFFLFLLPLTRNFQFYLKMWFVSYALSLFFHILHWNFCGCIWLANHPINFNNMGQLFISNFRHIKICQIYAEAVLLYIFFAVTIFLQWYENILIFCQRSICSTDPSTVFWITSSYWKLNSTMSEIKLYYKRVASCIRIAFLAKRLKKLTFSNFFFIFFF